MVNEGVVTPAPLVPLVESPVGEAVGVAGRLQHPVVEARVLVHPLSEARSGGRALAWVWEGLLS